MKLRTLFLLSTAGLLAALPVKSSADNWETIWDCPGYTAIAADPSGLVLSAGVSSAGVTDTSELAKPNPADVLWVASDLYQDSGYDPAVYSISMHACGFDSLGNMYCAGQLSPSGYSSPDSSWFVTKRAPGDQSWTTLYEPDGSLYQYVAGGYARAAAFAANPDPNLPDIYVVGFGQKRTVSGSGKNAKLRKENHWVVRRSRNAGQEWEVVDDLLLGAASDADAAAVVPDCGVFVAGGTFREAAGWVVRKSPSGDLNTWATVDNPPDEAAAHGVCSDSQGNIYVVGERSHSTTVKHQTTGYLNWVTRASGYADAGEASTWADVDIYAYPNPSSGTGSAVAYAAGRDAYGNVVVVGYASDGSNNHWIVRRPDASGNWVTVDDFQPGAGAVARSVTTDTAGDLLVVGSAYADLGDGGGTSAHMVLRKLPASAQWPATTP